MGQAEQILFASRTSLRLSPSKMPGSAPTQIASSKKSGSSRLKLRASWKEPERSRPFGILITVLTPYLYL
jgi:hypothetical protein